MKTIELIDKYEIRQSNDLDYDPPSYIWVDNTGELIRCESCCNWQTSWTPKSCPDGHYCEMMDTFTEAGEFCSRAERRES